MITLTDVRKRFGAVTAVDGMSLDAADGQITTLLGANGSGKTTSLRMIAGLIRPDSGQVSIDGIDVASSRGRALSRLGVLHDDFGLYPRLKVHEHIRYAGQLQGLSGAQLAAGVDRAISDLELEDLRNRFAAGFSHGQRMKTALARAIVHSPHNMILDEPTRGLDIFSIRTLRELLRSWRAAGRCILMSSHVMADVAELSDKVIIIHQGRMVMSGSPAEIIAKTGRGNLEEAFVLLAGQASGRNVA